jgi:hypothetical protein
MISWYIYHWRYHASIWFIMYCQMILCVPSIRLTNWGQACVSYNGYGIQWQQLNHVTLTFSGVKDLCQWVEHLSLPKIIWFMLTWPKPWKMCALCYISGDVSDAYFRWCLWLCCLLCVASAGSIPVLFEDGSLLLVLPLSGTLKILLRKLSPTFCAACSSLFHQQKDLQPRPQWLSKDSWRFLCFCSQAKQVISTECSGWCTMMPPRGGACHSTIARLWRTLRLLQSQCSQWSLGLLDIIACLS